MTCSPDQAPIDLTVTRTERDGHLVFHVVGELDLHTAPVMQREISESGRFSHPVVLDLAGVGFIDSTGIRALLAINSLAVESVGEPVTIANPTDVARRLLELTGIDQLCPLTP